MQRYLSGAAIAALLLTATPAAYAATQSAAASPQVYWVLSGQVARERMDDFKSLVRKIVAATEANEPGALEYEYNVGADGTTVQIFERYKNSAAVVTHVDNLGKTFAKDLLALFKPTGMVVYGAPDEAAKHAIAVFDPTYTMPLDGFTR